MSTVPAPSPTPQPKPVNPEPHPEPQDPEKGHVVKTPDPGKSEHPAV
jgi:hypothetical protein